MSRPKAAPLRTLEVHEHSYVRGPRPAKVAHSHADGNGPHLHADVGPATFTIDKDEWYALTGCKGGGRKTFSATPSGPQLEWLPPERTTFTVVFCDFGHSPEHERAGITAADYDRQRADFRAAAAEQAAGRRPNSDYEVGEGKGLAVANIACSFNLEPIYVYEDHRGVQP